MKRRTFFSSTFMAALSATITTPLAAKANENGNFTKKMLKPKSIKPGAIIALIAPSSPPAPAKIQKAIDNLTAMGFVVKPGNYCRQVNGYLAGTDAERLADIHAAFADPEVSAVWCIRGGYGCTRLLPLLNFDLIRRNPKPLIGYSDITALHIAFSQKAGLVSYHGQVGGGEMTSFTQDYLQKSLFAPQNQIELGIFPENLRLDGAFSPFIIYPGTASGKITGGNLSVLTAMVGTGFQPEFRHKIVCLEEIGEAPYRIDRLLTQLLQATDLRYAAGIVLGIFTNCEQKGDTPTLKLAETLKDRLGHLQIPVYYGAPFGHIDNQCVLPFGIHAKMNADAMTLTLAEEPTLAP